MGNIPPCVSCEGIGYTVAGDDVLEQHNPLQLTKGKSFNFETVTKGGPDTLDYSIVTPKRTTSALQTPSSTRKSKSKYVFVEDIEGKMEKIENDRRKKIGWPPFYVISKA